jgi:hypothetical protein
MFVEMWGFRRLLLSSNARIISNAPYACGAGFQLSLLSSISVIISGFSFCLRRGIPAFAVKLHLCYYLRLFFLPAARYFRGLKVPKGLRFLKRKLSKNQGIAAPT